MIVYGKQIFFYILNRHSKLIKRVFFSKKVDEKIFKEVKRLGVPIQSIDNKKAQSLAHGGNHQGFLLEIEDFKYADKKCLKEADFIVLLYKVTDVGNIGSIIRTSYVLGVDAVVISNVKQMKPEGFIRTSSGAALDIPIVLYQNAYELVNELKMQKFVIYATSFSGIDVRKVSFEGKKVLILGSEGEGVPQKLCKKSDIKVKIEMERDFDSLNVSAAAAILIDRMR
ncbi:23S rRNA (guanosine(2251)-2'-O)-methyltransferase RlmB [Nitrosophilus labii]|uniref:23S rRNA (guanosine(2251)-2'-O)-methyltransferase RlmB n=1 Tax=Nitrosophilus labii TaxID=2706014 RepID=UPI0016575AAF|nr:23S rRNA (guanosine(2251)-2'-O)-methyltransferase RlmB [Nitrosophilus labii]